MNEVIIDPATGQPVQKMQPQLNSMAVMPGQQVVETNPAVYNNQQVIQRANNMFGNQQQRNNTVSMIDPNAEIYNPNNTMVS